MNSSRFSVSLITPRIYYFHRAPETLTLFLNLINPRYRYYLEPLGWAVNTIFELFDKRGFRYEVLDYLNPISLIYGKAVSQEAAASPIYIHN